MIIKRIDIRNFRSYYGENSFEFSNRLTLIIGDNGDGKTTLFEALQWLFNTTMISPVLSNFSEMKKSELEIGESATVSVSMAFEHYGEKLVEKSFEVTKISEGRFSPGPLRFVGYEDRNSGREQVDGKILIARCFDAFLQKFSMFKGESDLNVFNDPTALQQLVAKFSDLRSFEKYVEYTTEFEKKSNAAYTKEAKSDEKISRQMGELESKLLEVNRLINYEENEISNLEATAETFKSKIDDLEKTRETSERYHEIQDRLKAKTAEAAQYKGRIAAMNFNVNLLDKMWILCAFPDVLKEFQNKSSTFSKRKRAENDQFIREQGKSEGRREVLDNFTSMVNGTSRLPWYLPNQETMEEMIHDHICKVCNREAPEGSDAYAFMCEKLEEYKRNAQKEAEAAKAKSEPAPKLFESSFTEEMHNLSLSLGGYNEAEVNGKTQEIKDAVDLAARFKKKLEDIEKSIEEAEDEKARILVQADGVSEEMLNKSFLDLKGYFESQGRAEKRVVELKKELESNRARQTEIKAQMDNLSPTKGQVLVYKKVHEAFEKIMKAFAGAKENNLTMFLSSLEARANEYLVRLNANDFHGLVHLVRTSNDSAKIKLLSSNEVEVMKPSGSQQTTMYMSVLFAISDLTTLKREEDYPLIFDAATSSFGDTKETDFYNIIGTLEKQCVIVTKDFISHKELRMNEIDKLDNCTVYRIQKADGYDSANLATIRTMVKKIK